ncbi:hypothetical protein [Hoylesella shahii]|uniref:hypothetical protein n=1 Tax=Hoylesella shahii TaxID=228603 RepID=UPI00288A2E18|nr:hypothetical protein [Hoylesella shahii]
MERKQQCASVAYIKPQTWVFCLSESCSIMATSPNVRPGGDNKGNVRVIEPVDDDEDTEIEG